MRITGTAKAIFSIVFFTCLICGMSACSSPSSSSNPSSSKAETQEVDSQSGNQEFNVPGEQQISAEIQAQDDYYNTYGLNVNSFSITKRQTNLDDKNDFVWCAVVASNSDFSYSAEYKVTYVLYNDGWLLEDCSKEASSVKASYYPTAENAVALLRNYCENAEKITIVETELIDTPMTDTSVTYPCRAVYVNEKAANFTYSSDYAIIYSFDLQSGWTATIDSNVMWWK